MLKKLFLLCTLFSSMALSAQTPALEILNAYGGSGDDVVRASALDRQGNIFAAGHYSDTVDFD